jgi:hypothetical protein
VRNPIAFFVCLVLIAAPATWMLSLAGLHLLLAAGIALVGGIAGLTGFSILVDWFRLRRLERYRDGG